ncbi:2-hydroxyacid dehydrogenase [Cupriavidus sp. M-11]|uniref:2-hydroxyacid dehydrogenase n=1 Tax=Cupriavidus sp. M-11 TaxID=3233038 RepID=UPI003F908F94
MGILVLIHPSLSAPLADALRKAAPDIPVWTSAAQAPVPEVECIMAWSLQDGVASSYPALKLISAPSAGVDKLLSATDLAPGMPVTRVVDPRQPLEIAQYVLAVTLRHTRELPCYEAQQLRVEWHRHPVRPAQKTRVGVLGLGQIGQAVARAMHGAAFHVAGWSRSRKALPGIATFAGESELGTLLSQSDILVCTLPLTADTHEILDRRRLSQLPQGAYLVNVGRGEHLVESDLIALLDSGHLAGAALDVYRAEPLPADSALWRHPRILATPHIAAQASFDLVAQQCVENVRRVRSGLAVLNEVDRARGY